MVSTNREYCGRMAESASARRKRLSMAWLVAFGVLLGLTLVLAFLSTPGEPPSPSPPPSSSVVSSPTGSVAPAPPPPSSSVIFSPSVSPSSSTSPSSPTVASGPDLTVWVAVSALGTLTAGLCALISGVAAVAAARAAARQRTVPTSGPARTTRKRKRR
jgi:cytoskeletal protein RodZ